MEPSVSGKGMRKTRIAKLRQSPDDGQTVQGAVPNPSLPLVDFDALLEQASQRFEQLFQGLPVSCFCYDAEGRIMEWNRGSEALFGRPAASAFLQPAWEMVGRSEDADILRAIIRSVIAGEAYEGLEWEQPPPGGGPPKHLLCNVFPLRDRAGAIYGGVTVSVDISGRARAEQALRESEERWQLALRGNNDGIWDWNARAGRLFVSARCHQIFGEETTDACSRTGARDMMAGPVGEALANGCEPAGFRDAWFERVHAEDRQSAWEAFRAHLDGQASFYSSEHRVGCPDGSCRWVLDRGQALWDRSGALVRVAGSVTDITERKRAEEMVRDHAVVLEFQKRALEDANRQMEEANAKLEALATTDGLTGLKNHRAFQERLAMETERARRYGLPLSIALLDVDHFKQYNDTYGHPAGDAVLRTVAACLQSSVREADQVARYGGEEFALILPHTPADAALLVAERCRRAIESAAWPDRPVTASVGVAALTPALAGPADLLVAADQALYRSKREGRNRITAA